MRNRITDILTSKEGMSLQVDISRLSDSSSLAEDLALDSIQILEFGLAIEGEFGISIPPERFASELDRFGSLVAYLTQYQQATG